ncbi:AIF1 [Sanghuangporus vaninii]
MSTTSIAVLSESELKDGELKEVAFGDEGKILLSRIGDKIHATSAFCTHYGAPLSKGVLTADGRVVCPWHGACFNVCTGDIEDAPALDGLHSFKAVVKDGKIQVTADPKRTLKDNKSRPLAITTEATAASGNGVVIVGGGAGAIHTVESLRENGYKGNITIISAERYAPIDRTKMSKALIHDPSKLEWRSAADLKIKYNTNLRIGTTVTYVDTESKTVTLDTKETLAYDSLVLAPGGTPRRLPIEGANLGNIFTLRHAEDAKAIDAAAQKGKRVVVIGSSFISMEIVVAIAKRELASIDVIGMEEYPFEAILGAEIGKGLKQFHESQGVKFHMKSKVAKLVPSEYDQSVVGAVVLGDGGPTLPADFVIMGVGVAPATGFLKDSGFTLERDGGVRVDEFLRIQGQNGNVFAIGDIAVFPQTESSEPRRIEHWNVASNHGRAVGRAIAGKPEPFAKIPIFWSAQGQQLRYCGLGHSYDDIFIKGNPSELKFVAYYFKAGKVVAVASMQTDPIMTKASELMRLGLMPSAEEIKGGLDILSIDIASVQAKSKFKA